MQHASLLIILLFLLAACSTAPKVTIFAPTPVEVRVELAQSTEELQRGMMFREQLDDDAGMLFVFAYEQQRTFWMKNTLIPLDMLFIDANGTIVAILHAVPCEDDPCPLYPSETPAQYVLEVNSGFAEQHHIALGQKVALPE